MRLRLLLLAALPLCAQTPDLDTGRRIFESQCALCHGPDGSGGRGPSLRKSKLRNAPDDEALRKAIADGLPPEMPGAWQISPREVASTALYVRSLGKVAIEELPGNPAVGKELFTKNGCTNCHIVNGQGTGRGPELSAIGGRRNARHLRESLTNPSAFVPDDFLAVEVTTADGRTVRGVRANEDLFSLQLALPNGRFASFQKANIRSLKRLTGQSTMPAFDKLPADSIDDLVAYLASLRGTE